MTERDAQTPHDCFFYAYKGQAVRYGDWKYHGKEYFAYKKSAHEQGATTLCNLKDDIGESRNIIGEHPETAAQLDRALQAHPVRPAL